MLLDAWRHSARSWRLDLPWDCRWKYRLSAGLYRAADGQRLDLVTQEGGGGATGIQLGRHAPSPKRTCQRTRALCPFKPVWMPIWATRWTWWGAT